MDLAAKFISVFTVDVPPVADMTSAPGIMEKVYAMYARGVELHVAEDVIKRIAASLYTPATASSTWAAGTPEVYHWYNIAVCAIIVMMVTSMTMSMLWTFLKVWIVAIRVIDHHTRPVIYEAPHRASSVWYALKRGPQWLRVKYRCWREKRADPYDFRDHHRIATAVLEVMTAPPKPGDIAAYPRRVAAALQCDVELPVPYGCPWCVGAYNQLEHRVIACEGIPRDHSCVGDYGIQKSIQCFDGVIGLVIARRDRVESLKEAMLEATVEGPFKLPSGVISESEHVPELRPELKLVCESVKLLQVEVKHKGKNKERHNVDRKHYAGKAQVWTDDEYNRKQHLIDEGRYDLVEEMLLEKYASCMGDTRGMGATQYDDGMTYQEFRRRELRLDHNDAPLPERVRQTWNQTRQGARGFGPPRGGYTEGPDKPPVYFIADGEKVSLYHSPEQLRELEAVVDGDRVSRAKAIAAVSPPEAYMEDNPEALSEREEAEMDARVEARRRKQKARDRESPTGNNPSPVPVIKQDVEVSTGVWTSGSKANPRFEEASSPYPLTWQPTIPAKGIESRRQPPPKMESPVHGGAIRPCTSLPNAAMLWDFQDDGRYIGWMNGFLVKGPPGIQGSMYFVTARHLTETGDGDPANYFRTPRTVPMVRFPTTAQFETVAVVYEASMDRLVLNISWIPRDFTQPRFTNPKVGGSVTLFAFDGTGWNFSQGEVAAVANDGLTFNYTASTKGGFCRTPVLTRSGAICGGHFGGEVTINCITKPAAWIETGTIRKGIQEFTPVSLDRGDNLPPGVVQAPPSNLRSYRRREQQKVYPLRTDMAFKHVRHRHIMMRPSTDMLKDEVSRFTEPLPLGPTGAPRVINQTRLAAAFRIVCRIESDKQGGCSVPWSEPTLDEALERMACLLQGTHTAGANSHEMSQAEYISSLCEDESLHGEAREQAGLVVLAKKVLEYIQDMTSGNQSEVTREFDEICGIWLVMGKKDGYKPKKLTIGRSVQAPCVLLKALWLVMFKPSDDAWSSRDFMFREGYDFNRALPRHLRRRYEQILKSLSLDATAWDRFFPREFLELFHNYMEFCNPGVPHEVVRMLFQWTTFAELLFTDGSSLHKGRGNPSGHPNTLRLNCFGNFLAWVYVLLEDLTEEEVYSLIVDEDLFFEFCGDDSRVSALTPLGCRVLDAQQCLYVFSRDLPWEMKVEGYWVRDVTIPLHLDILNMPPFISRTTLIVDGIMWTPYLDPSRVLRKLLHEMGRTRENEEELVTNMNDILGLLDFWDASGKIRCPAVAEVREKLPDWRFGVSRSVASRHYLLYYTS
jgi:hypothetical protein